MEYSHKIITAPSRRPRPETGDPKTEDPNNGIPLITGVLKRDFTVFVCDGEFLKLTRSDSEYTLENQKIQIKLNSQFLILLSVTRQSEVTFSSNTLPLLTYERDKVLSC